jgi:hypothetical protein
VTGDTQSEHEREATRVRRQPVDRRHESTASTLERRAAGRPDARDDTRADTTEWREERRDEFDEP